MIVIPSEAARIADTHLLSRIAALYGLEGYHITPVKAHEGGRNLAYSCEKEAAGGRVAGGRIVRISFLGDRSRDHLLGEVEYIRYLSEHGASVADVVHSREGHLLEEISYNGHTFYVCVFVKAGGKLLVENHYRYRQGVPLTEYFYNCGQVLGKMHQLSKEYVPVHRRYHFLEKYNPQYIDDLIPPSLPLLKGRLVELLETLEGVEQTRDTYGMVHLDYSDGNYMIDFDTGQITVFDFDDSCFCWYMYDLANVWTHGVGWVQFEPDPRKRERFMHDYFEAVLTGYRTETEIDDAMLDMLPLFIRATVMENILSAFEGMRNNGEAPACDEELAYLIRCMEDDVPHKGFFREMYSAEAPFQCEEREI